MFAFGVTTAVTLVGVLSTPQPYASAAVRRTADLHRSVATKSLNLSGVTLTFGDQLKEYQTIFQATDALKGAAYTVNWSDFVGGPPIIAAETGGSVDLGDMAETPTIFAEAAGDPVKVVAVTVGSNPKKSPYDIVVPSHSSITSVSQLRGKSVAVQEGTVYQYVLAQALKKANIPYSAVTIENLTYTNASTAVANGKVDAAVIGQPLTALDQQSGQIRVLETGAGIAPVFGYLTASQSALDNPKEAAAISDFIARFYKASALLKKDPLLAAETYVKTFGVPLAVAKVAVASDQGVASPITSAVISYEQNEANTFYKLGLITKQVNVKSLFDLPFNKVVTKAAGITS
ncbi:MAG TPA: ABC transporter substrate-binding protein [Acidimicrobiales bacterium]